MALLALLLYHGMKLLHSLAFDMRSLLAQEILELCQIDFSLDIDLEDEVDSIISKLLFVLDKGIVVDFYKL